MDRNILAYIAKLSTLDKKTLSQKALKTAEEVGELAKVILPYDGAANTTHRFIEKERILEEVADTILCALSVAYDLDFTDDEIAGMMFKKAQYWEQLQTRESKALYPLPYEIHITTAGGTVENTKIRLEEFKTACAEIGVKPLLIDLHNKMGETIMLDTQTSSIHMGDNTSAINEVRRITKGLTERGFNVIREKIETVPWHPAAPSSKDGMIAKMPKDCYFEAHFNIVVNDESLPDLRNMSTDWEFHLSRNAFKHISETEYIMMATIRAYHGTYEDFKAICEDMVELFEVNGFVVPKTITEFSIYDTRVTHDEEWIGNA